VVPKPREQCNKGEQLAVTFTAGYIGSQHRIQMLKPCAAPNSQQKKCAAQIAIPITCRCSGRVLRDRVAPGRLGGVGAEQGEGLDGHGCRQAPRLVRVVEWSRTAYHHDRHTHRAPGSNFIFIPWFSHKLIKIAVVHL